MKICLIVLGFAPVRTSGLDVSAERLVAALLEAGHEVTVLAGARASQPESWHHPALTIHRLPLGRSNWIRYARRAAQLAQRLNHPRRFDVVHFWDVHFAYAYSGAYVASLHQSFRQRWRAFERQQPSPPVLAYRWMYYTLARVLAEQRSLRHASGLLAVSAATCNEFVKNYAIAPERIALARHGIDIQRFRPQAVTDELRSRYGLKSGEPVLLFAGFVTPRKGLEYLAQALPLIQPRPRLIIAGRWSPRYRARFVQMLGPAAGCLVEAGFVPDEQMPDLYNLADVYVSPSLLEGFGLPLAEAMACETPVVAAEAGSVAEVVGPGGILVPPGDASALARAVSQILADRDLAQALGQRGREHVVANFTVGRMVQDTVSAYHQFTAPQGKTWNMNTRS